MDLDDLVDTATEAYLKIAHGAEKIANVVRELHIVTYNIQRENMHLKAKIKELEAQISEHRRWNDDTVTIKRVSLPAPEENRGAVS